MINITLKQCHVPDGLAVDCRIKLLAPPALANFLQKCLLIALIAIIEILSSIFWQDFCYINVMFRILSSFQSFIVLCTHSYQDYRACLRQEKEIKFSLFYLQNWGSIL